jgi:ABC-type amino acid transport substrate-binding protein
MVKSGFSLNLIAIVIIIYLTAAQCQPTPTPEPTYQPAPPPPPRGGRPLPAGDGTDLIDHLLETGIIRVGIRVWPDATYSPPAFRGFSNAQTGGALNGFEVDLAHQLAEGLGLELELVEAYPPVIDSGDWRGQWDIALASLAPFDQPPASARTTLFYTRPYGYIPLGLLVPATASNIAGLPDLADSKVGVLEHSPYQRLLTEGPTLTVNQQPLLKELPAAVQPVPVSNLSKAIHQLAQLEGEEAPPFAAIFGPVPIFQEAIKSELPVSLTADSERLAVQPLAVATVPQGGLKVDRMIQAMNQVLDRLDRQGALAEIYLKWYGQDFSQNSPPVSTDHDQNKSD